MKQSTFRRSLASSLEEILAAAIRVTQANFGVVRMRQAQSAGLRIVAQRGFPQWWFDDFETIEPGTAPCGPALAVGTRIAAEDVEGDPVFVGTPALALMRKAGVRAFQSTPINSDDGKCLGWISTCFRHPHAFGAQETYLLDLAARHAGDLIQRERAEEALRISERRHRTLIESVAAVTWHCPASGLFEEPQPSWMEYSGQTAEEMMGTGWMKAVHPGDMEVASRRWREAFERGTAFRNVHRVRRHDGAWRWMRVTAVPLRDESGTVVEWFGTNVDITRRRMLEDALRSSEHNLRAMFENAGVGIALLSPDRRFLATNDRLCEILGYTREELLRMSPLDVHVPEEREFEAARITEAFEGTRSDYRAEKRNVRKDGKIIWVRVTATPIRTANEEIVGSVSIVEDITAQKEAERSLAESEELVRLLFENSPIALVVADVNGKPVLVNAAAQRFVPNSLIPSRDQTQLPLWAGTNADGSPFKPRDFPMERALRGERVVPGVEMQYTDAQGNKSSLLVHAVPVYDAQGRLNGGFAALSDVTDRSAIKELLGHVPKLNALAELSSGLAAADAERSLSRLTRREAEVLRSIVAGRSNKEIARDLNLSPRTVENHRANLMKKLDVRHLSQLVTLWLTANPRP